MSYSLHIAADLRTDAKTLVSHLARSHTHIVAIGLSHRSILRLSSRSQRAPLFTICRLDTARDRLLRTLLVIREWRSFCTRWKRQHVADAIARVILLLHGIRFGSGKYCWTEFGRKSFRTCYCESGTLQFIANASWSLCSATSLQRGLAMGIVGE